MLTQCIPVSGVNNSLKGVWCPDHYHNSWLWGTLQSVVRREHRLKTEHLPLYPSSGTSQATIFGPCSILVSNHGALELSVLHLHVKTSPGPGCKGPNLEWQSSARDSWSTKEAWLSSSSQSPAAPLTHSTSIQQRDRGMLPRALTFSYWIKENGALLL